MTTKSGGDAPIEPTANPETGAAAETVTNTDTGSTEETDETVETVEEKAKPEMDEFGQVYKPLN